MQTIKIEAPDNANVEIRVNGEQWPVKNGTARRRPGAGDVYLHAGSREHYMVVATPGEITLIRLGDGACWSNHSTANDVFNGDGCDFCFIGKASDVIRVEPKS